MRTRVAAEILDEKRWCTKCGCRQQVKARRWMIELLAFFCMECDLMVDLRRYEPIQRKKPNTASQPIGRVAVGLRGAAWT